MIEFHDALEERINSILQPAIGPGSDPNEYVKTFDNYLHDVDVSLLPFVVIAVRTAEKLLPGEIGVPYQKYTWTAHIYYLDMETDPAKYTTALNRRNHILGRIEKTLEQHRLLNNLETVDADNHREKVYDSSIQAIVFDQTGQDTNYSFVSELYLEVYTDRI